MLKGLALSVDQTPPAPPSTAEQTRIDTSVAPIARVVTPPQLQPLPYLVVDGSCSQQTCVDGLRALARHRVGQRHCDANLRYLYHGPRHRGPGRPKLDAEQVTFHHLARFEPGESGDAAMARYHQVVNHVPLKRHLRLVLVCHRPTGRYALLCSPDVALSAQTISRSDTARFQIELLCRDANQCTGLRAWQARAAHTWRFQCNARLSAVSFAQLAARQRADKRGVPCSRASLKRRCFHQHRLDRILDQLAIEGSVEKSSPVSEELCNYGIMHDMAA